MKFKYLLLIVIGLGVIAPPTTLAQKQNSLSSLKLIVRSEKTNYQLGEIVPVSLELKNVSSKDAYIGDIFGVGGGSVTIHISKDGIIFPEYNPGWGQIDFGFTTITTIKPNKSVNSSANILWHSKPNALQGESREVVQEVAKKTLLTDYAFPEAGTYYVKAIFEGKLESEPVRITIREPVGEDVKIWDKIKNRGEIGFFMYRNYFQIPEYRLEETARFQTEIEQLIKLYPNSFIISQLEKSLAEYRAMKVRIENQKQKKN